ncbi:PDC sensor domain-containing protein [Acanthopleuribacter pedis]|uniref:Cache domain-containing protein n=1 Tax=Acanthopleuribacter pedis TaxID=442870 RepID=A0A8J7U7Q7_9BACT|nr:cache domain-containing protein [Acanthopleuribacter pedis]MBO1323249.1 cache domain-containing protein [Acanthopleuribacter pedis]
MTAKPNNASSVGRTGRPLYRIIFWLCGLMTAALIVWGGTYLHRRDARLQQARTDAEARVRQANRDMEASLNRLVPVNIQISEDLTSGKLPANRDAVEARLRAVKKNVPEIFGVGVAYVPYGFRDDLRLYAPLFVDSGEGAHLVQIEDKYDYTDQDRPWYQLPLKRGPIWQEPHYGIASQSFLANFTTPFFTTDATTGEKRPNGVVFTSMSIDQFDRLIHSLRLYETGYGFLVSGKGAFVAHPNGEWVKENHTIQQWADESGDAALKELAAGTVVGKRGFVSHQDAATGKHQWVFTEPIVSTGWSLGMVFDKENIAGWKALEQERQALQITALVTGLGWITAFVLFGQNRRQRRREENQTAAPTQEVAAAS